MIRTAASDEYDSLKALNGFTFQANFRECDVATLGNDSPAKCVPDCTGLLEDLLEHEMGVATLLRHGRIPHNSHGTAFHRLTRERRHFNTRSGHHDYFVV